jgi:hypothetical protein
MVACSEHGLTCKPGEPIKDYENNLPGGLVHSIVVVCSANKTGCASDDQYPLQRRVTGLQNFGAFFLGLMHSIIRFVRGANNDYAEIGPSWRARS